MIAVIDYGAGNLQSVCNALERLNQSFQVIAGPELLPRFEKIILPGVSAAGHAMEVLNARGFSKIFRDVKVPVLGICLGLQLFSDFSEENDTTCLGIIPGRVKKFPPVLKIPQIGWNSVKFLKKNPLLENLSEQNAKALYFYFANSYYFDPPREFVLGSTSYGIDFPSIVQKENFYGVQFHPEKSGSLGLRILRNFCEKC